MPTNDQTSAGTTEAASTETVVDESADDIFAKAFAQLSKADAEENAPEPRVVLGTTKEGRTEAERTTSEAQRDAATFAKDTAGPTGPSGSATQAATTTGTTGATGVTGDGGLPPDDKAKAATEAAAAETARVAAEAAKATTTKEPDAIERLADLLSKRGDQTQTQTQTQADPLAIFSPQEKAFLADYEKEYPDIARAEFMRRRVEYTQFATWMFAQLNAAYGPKFADYDTLLQRTHAGDIQQQVPIYSNELREATINWVATQKPYKRVAYEHVINQGTPDEVADLISDFTKATGYAPKAPAQTQQTQQSATMQQSATTQQVADPTKAAEAAKLAKAAAALAPVQGKNAQRAVTVIAPGDYDGAFDWATRELASL